MFLYFFSISEIPSILRKLEPEAESMGAIAREQWERHFGVEAAFNWIGDSLEAAREHVNDFQAVISRNPTFELIKAGQTIPYFKSQFRFRL